MAYRPKVCIDRVLPTAESRPQRTMRIGGRVRAISPIGKTWMNGSTLRVRFLAGTSAEQTLVREQAGWWTEHANLTFDFGTAPDADIRIAFDPSDGAWSYIGTDCKHIPAGQPTMNLGFLDGGTAAHEFGHAIGLAHEHQNPAGGIEWKEEVVIHDLSGPPNNWDEDTIRHNVLEKYRIDQINGTAFDGDSIMLYFFPGSWTVSGVGTKANDVLSATDESFIAGEKMYPRDAPTPDDARELSIKAKSRTRASIGKFGEEDLFRFTAPTEGDYVIDTRGPTDVVLKLFGPNSRTALIAEDDDSGVDFNARIGARLQAGEYFAQVRHYNRQSGVGKYSIRVTKA
jgi:hypothetical protein